MMRGFHLAALSEAYTVVAHLACRDNAAGEALRLVQDEVRFDGRAVLVTGAGRGLGRSYALLLASRGAKVVVADNGSAMDGADGSTAPASSVVEEIRAAGGEAVACFEDIASEAGSASAVETCLGAFGRIDGLLHNASTLPNLVSADQLSSEDLERVMKINPFASIWLTRAAWPHMVAQAYGRIVFTSSSGIYGNLGNALYASAKSACIGLMRCFAVEGAKHGIIVNAVAPSARSRMTERFPKTPFTDWFLETMTPERAAVAGAYLMSEQCNHHGQMFVSGGGRLARITLAETEGYMGEGASIEEVRDAMPGVLADGSYYFPRDFSERAAKMAELHNIGSGGIDANSDFAMAPITKD
jgi:NAD(P)-dependent dehydrogenase (short-subunit alcohol dehydrogenase family)